MTGMTGDDQVKSSEETGADMRDVPAVPGEAAETAPDTDAPTTTTLRDELAALKARVAQLEHEVEAERDSGTDYMRKWQQAQADLSNFRRRAQKEAEQFAELAAAQAMELVLPALDSFERAFKTLPESLARLTWIEGIALVDFQLRRALELHGVEPFEPKPGDALDPTRHQAIAHAETSAHPEGSVVEVVQRGYALHGRALRPALVRVARPPAKEGDTSGGRPPDALTGSDASEEAPGGSGLAPPGSSP